jgi:hypothetical protein
VNGPLTTAETPNSDLPTFVSGKPEGSKQVGEKVSVQAKRPTPHGVQVIDFAG